MRVLADKATIQPLIDRRSAIAQRLRSPTDSERREMSVINNLLSIYDVGPEYDIEFTSELLDRMATHLDMNAEGGIGIDLYKELYGREVVCGKGKMVSRYKEAEEWEIEAGAVPVAYIGHILERAKAETMPADERLLVDGILRRASGRPN